MLADFFDRSFKQALSQFRPGVYKRLIHERGPDAYLIPNYRAPRRLRYMGSLEEAQYLGPNLPSSFSSRGSLPLWHTAELSASAGAAEMALPISHPS